MFSLKKVSPIFYVSTLFVLIPLLNSFEIENGIYLFVSSIGFLFSYLGILYTDNRKMDIAFWIYMNLYIIIITFINPLMAMFIAYLVNLITWHYKEKSLLSKKSISMWVTTFFVIVVVIVSPLHIINKVVIMSSISISVAMLIMVRFSREQELLKEAVYEKNKSINLLLADNERNRISRDLHDTLGHVFSVISIKSELSLMLLKQEKYDLLEKELIDIKNVSNSEMKNVRHLIEGLQNRTILEELNVIQNMLSIANIKLDLMNDKFDDVPVNIQNNTAMILRELTNNLLKHSRASCCKLHLKNSGNELNIVYEDDGIGFDSLTGDELKSIRNRLVILRGDLKFYSLKNPTIIEITVPLEEL